MHIGSDDDPERRGEWLRIAAMAVMVVMAASVHAAEPVPVDSAAGGGATLDGERLEAERAELMRPGRRFRDDLASGGRGPPMVVLPAGTFEMGCVSGRGCDEDEKPVRGVTIPAPFAMGVYEVTFEEWNACVAAGGCGEYRPDDRGWGRGSHPVIGVSRDEAQSYVEWLSAETGGPYRLPSESEWEYAARAGTTTPFHTGPTISTDQANYDGNYTFGAGPEGVNRGETVPVGSFPANAWGLHDMHGNVWEWTADCWNGSYAGAPTDGSAWETGDCTLRVLRGGSWFNEPWDLRCAFRIGVTTGNRGNDVGFRVARTLAP